MSGDLVWHTVEIIHQESAEDGRYLELRFPADTNNQTIVCISLVAAAKIAVQARHAVTTLVREQTQREHHGRRRSPSEVETHLRRKR